MGKLTVDTHYCGIELPATEAQITLLCESLVDLFKLPGGVNTTQRLVANINEGIANDRSGSIKIRSCSLDFRLIGGNILYSICQPKDTFRVQENKLLSLAGMTGKHPLIKAYSVTGLPISLQKEKLQGSVMAVFGLDLKLSEEYINIKLSDPCVLSFTLTQTGVSRSQVEMKVCQIRGLGADTCLNR